MMSTPSPFLTALLAHQVDSSVVDCDHYRIGVGLAVETDYIISVIPKGSAKESFEAFKLSKTYSAFRTFASQLAKAAEPKSGQKSITKEQQQAVHFSHAVLNLVDSQKTSYLGKVNFNHVRTLAKQRSQIINDALETILKNAPTTNTPSAVVATIETFFLTDHCVETANHTHPFDIRRMLPPLHSNISKIFKTSGSRSVEIPPPEEDEFRIPSTPVIPRSSVVRRSFDVRFSDDAEMEQVPKVGEANFMEENSHVVLPIMVGAVAILKAVGGLTVRVDLDVVLLVCFSFFCMGYHFSKPQITFPASPTMMHKPDSLMVNSTAIVNSMGQAVIEVSSHDDVIESPMLAYPNGAALGEYFNRWSAPKHNEFKVRGPQYLKDKKKVPSGEFLFPARGVDLFLTDTCPQHIGTNTGIIGGHLRDVPTFLINFRLPWGILIFYFEIPDRFIPWVQKGHDPTFDPTNLPSLDSMTPGDRTLCRFLSGTQQHKDDVWKIVPVVVEGPWISKQAVGGKPAIIGTKIPVNYIYQPAEGDKAMYLEADVDIVASSAARGILSVVRSGTQSLTLDLGFVVQGMQEDELPEQMMVGCRLHGLDPLHAPCLPTMSHDISEAMQVHTEEEELTGSLSY